MNTTRVLFVCVHNSARSQMAEAWLTHLAGGRFVAESAGLEPGRLNPLAVDVMREAGLDISGRQTKALADVMTPGRRFDYVITVCDDAAAERCPVVPGAGARLHWSFPDPSLCTGTDDERLAQTRAVRDAIRDRVCVWMQSLDEEGSGMANTAQQPQARPPKAKGWWARLLQKLDKRLEAKSRQSCGCSQPGNKKDACC